MRCLSKSTPLCSSLPRSKVTSSTFHLTCHQQQVLKAIMISNSMASITLISNSNRIIKFKCNKTKTIKHNNMLSKSRNNSIYNGAIHLITLAVAGQPLKIMSRKQVCTQKRTM